jgi:hypothetical protein
MSSPSGEVARVCAKRAPILFLGIGPVYPAVLAKCVKRQAESCATLAHGLCSGMATGATTGVTDPGARRVSLPYDVVGTGCVATRTNSCQCHFNLLQTMMS